MKTSHLLLLLTTVGLASFGGWKLGRQQPATPSPDSTASNRRVLFYQSPMHPWIKSDQPGNCTICGMKLVPVYEGQTAATGDASNVIQLSAESINVVHVQTAPVVRQPLKRRIHVAGVIDDDDSAHRLLSAYVEGRIDKLFVNYVGAEVTAGQPLASLYSRELLVARGEYLEALRQAATPDREAFRAAIRQKLRRLGLTAEQIEKLPGQTGDTIDIVAPITGTVVARKVYEGQYVKEGDVLFEIADFSKMWFVFSAYERDLAWIRLGQTVEVTTPSVPGKTFSAPIGFIDPNLDTETRSARVRVVLQNPRVGDPATHRRELLHQVYADGRIKVETEPVLTVPRSAVLSAGTEPLVYLAREGNYFEPRRVLLGRAGETDWEVLSGLAEGERVVTEGNLLIDAQSQLVQPNATPTPSEASPVTLIDAQFAGARQLLTAASGVSTALAADDLASHTAQVGALRAAALAFAETLGAKGQSLKSLAAVEPVKDLVTARRQFYPLSMAVAQLAAQWRKQLPEFHDVKIFECPMAKSAVPSAETNVGRWVQASGPIRNPFFGSEMLECGAEVKP